MSGGKREFISREEALKSAFFTGMALGFELGVLPSTIAPTIAKLTDEKKVAQVIQKKIDSIFSGFRVERGEPLDPEKK
jgi:hypothetical protein